VRINHRRKAEFLLMKSFKYAINDVKKHLTYFIAFDSLLTSLLIYLGVYFVFVSIAFKGVLAILPAGLYLWYDLRLKLRQNVVRNVEEKYPDMDEQLITASEYPQDENNPFVNELHRETMSELKKVELSRFIDMNVNSKKLGGIVVLSLLIIVFAHFGLYYDVTGNFGDIVDKVKPVFSQGGDDSGSGGTEQVVGKEGGSDIYGEASLADLGDDAVDLSLLSNNMEFDSTNIYDIQERQFKDVMLFPSDIQTVESDVSTQGEVSKEHAELVKNYFLQAAR